VQAEIAGAQSSKISRSLLLDLILVPLVLSGDLADSQRIGPLCLERGLGVGQGLGSALRCLLRSVCPALVGLGPPRGPAEREAQQ